MTTKNHNLLVIIKRTPNELVLLITGLWTLAWAAAEGTILFGLLSDKKKGDDGLLIFTFILLLVVGLFVCRVFLWHLRGKEIIEIRYDEFKIRHVGTIFPSTRNFEFSLTENFKYIDKQSIPLWVKFWGLGGGHIEFEYLGQKKYFGQTIDARKAKEIVSRLLDIQKTTTH